MKKTIASLFVILSLAFNSSAADKHDHEHAKAGPTGGKLITKVEPHAEFFVTTAKKIEIRFVNEDNKVVSPGDQVVTVTMGDRGNPTKLTFAKDGDKLISDKAIPEGNELPTVVQIKAKPGEKAVTEKFNLNLSECPECKHPEYACTCAHNHDEKK